MNINLILFIILITVFSANAQSVKNNGQLQVKGTQLVNENNEPLMLRGVSFGWHNWFPRFYNKQTVYWLVDDWKCNVVRAAIGIEPDGGYLSHPHFAEKKVEAVVNAAIEKDIYVIIDWHSHNINLEAAKGFFAEMAKKYGKYPNVIYEIFNEPDYEAWVDVKSYSAELIATIRKYDEDNVILVGNPHWDQDVHMVADDPLEGYNNIMYTLHYYAATHKDSLRQRGDYALQKGIPIFISECAGMEANGDNPINYDEWQTWIDWSEENKISWVIWSIADKDETCSMLNKGASSKGKWKEGELKESGIKTRELLRKYNK